MQQEQSGLDFLSRWLESIERRFGRAGSLLIIAICISILSLFFAYPVELLKSFVAATASQTPNERFLRIYLPLSRDPWHTTFSTAAYQAVRHRILGPVIAWCLGLRGPSSAVIPILANPLIYMASFVLLKKKTNAVIAFLSTAILSLTLVCVTSQVWMGYQDSLANLFLLLSLLIESPALSALCVFVGMLADERILAAGMLVLMWHAQDRQTWAERRRDALRRGAWLVASAALWCIYMMGQKYFYGTNFHAGYSAARRDFMKYFWNIWPSWYYALRLGWLLPALAVWVWAASKKRWAALLLILSVLPVFVAAIQVYDVSRVGSFAFPAMLIAVVALYRHRVRYLEPLLAMVLLGQILSPNYIGYGEWLQLVSPLPTVMADELSHHFDPSPKLTSATVHVR